MAQTAVRLQETAFTGGDLADRVDEEQGVIKDVKILGRESKNGRVYTPEAMRRAAELYEGTSVYIDHREKNLSAGNRGVRSHWGRLTTCRVKTDGVYGNLEYLRTHAETPALIERAQRFPRNFGLSHDAYGAITHRNGVDYVEDLESVESVDVVSKPATNLGLFESEGDRSQTMLVKEALKKSTHKDARRLRKLLEEDGFSAMAEEPVTAEEGASAEEEMKASIKALVNAVLDDDSLDNQGKIAKIRQILNVSDKLQEKPGESSGGSDGGDEGDDTEEKTMESIQGRLDAMEQRDILRDLLEDKGLRMSDLDSSQRKLLLKQDEEDMSTLLESMNLTGKQTPPEQTPPKTKPNVRPVRESKGGTYDQALKEAKGST